MSHEFNLAIGTCDDSIITQNIDAYFLFKTIVITCLTRTCFTSRDSEQSVIKD